MSIEKMEEMKGKLKAIKDHKNYKINELIRIRLEKISAEINSMAEILTDLIDIMIKERT